MNHPCGLLLIGLVCGLASAAAPLRGEEQAALPAEKLAASREIKWEAGHRDAFDDPDCAKNYFKFGDGALEWSMKFKAMVLYAEEGKQIYAAVHRALPGDLRIRFRARAPKSEKDINIGVLFSVRGALADEHGYFAEWAGGIAQIKKKNRSEKQAEAPTPQTADRWVRLEVRRVGRTITLFMEDAQVLEWIDPKPLSGPEYDLLSFYVWSGRTLLDDVIIERNADDLVKPLLDDPAAESNALNSIRNK